MEQLSLLVTPEEKAFEALRPALVDILWEYNLDSSDLRFRSNKGYYSILFKESSVVAQLGGKKKVYMAVPTSALQATSGYSSAADPNQGLYTKFPVKTFDLVAEKYKFMLQEVLRAIIERGSKEFDCCSRYEECSDAKRCIHPDPTFGIKCGYRKNLRDGKIFYGAKPTVKA
ncbi:MAG: hypothetical protein IJT41_05495 [Clostridia bacterium]|nr:hypothetical protein [Clostridia bacterium]